MADGGYYAIKGFAFQFDRAILEILMSADEQQMVSLENIQDIDTDRFVMQVKYRESQDFSENKIREPVLQLIETYREKPNQAYVLYCHFRNMDPGIERPDLDKLNKILTLSNGKSAPLVALNQRIKALSQQLRTSFCVNFQIVYAPDYDSQFDNVLKTLMKLPYVRTEDLAIIFYGMIVEQLKTLVISTSNPTKRKTCRRDVLEHLGRGKKLVFGAAFEEYKGASAYFSLAKKAFIPLSKSQNTLFLFGTELVEEDMPLGVLILSVIEHWFRRATYDVEPPTFVVSDFQAQKVKTLLLQEGIRFNDGFETIEFSSRLFQEPPVKTRKSVAGRASDSLNQISFKANLISRSSLLKCAKELNPRMVLCFDSPSDPAFESLSTQQFFGLSTKSIRELVCK